MIEQPQGNLFILYSYSFCISGNCTVENNMRKIVKKSVNLTQLECFMIMLETELIYENKTFYKNNNYKNNLSMKSNDYLIRIRYYF